MHDHLLHLSLKRKEQISCKYCKEPLLNVRCDAKTDHTIIIPNKNEGIEISCPSCKTINAFTKKECINNQVRCLKCDKLLGKAYPGMPDCIDSLGKKTLFYKLKIACPNSKCSKINEFFI